VTLFLELAGVAVLILLNAFFVAAEYGLVTARRTRIIELHHQGNRRARDVLRITGDPPRFIAAMQLGVTLTSLGIGALGEHALSQAFNPWMATALAIALAYLILTFFHVVVGELVLVGERLKLLLVDEAALGGLLEQALGGAEVVQMYRFAQLNPFLSGAAAGDPGHSGPGARH